MNTNKLTTLKRPFRGPELLRVLGVLCSREQVKLEMQARFCRQEMSREEADRLRSYPYAETTLSYPLPQSRGLLSLASSAASWPTT